MKVTKRQLKRIIKEELEATLKEVAPGPTQYYDRDTVREYYPKIYELFSQAIDSGTLTIAMQGRGFDSELVYKVGDGPFKPTGEVSNDTGQLPANLKQIKADLLGAPQ